MKKVKYKQCRLVKEIDETRRTSIISWIPEKFAVVGDTLKLKNDNDEWDNGYVVEFASEIAIDEPPDYRKAIRNHKKSTGDSLPKEEPLTNSHRR